MIRIFVKEKELVLNRNTTMTVELNNALFANADVEGDVSYTFTLPVDGNERLLGFPSLPQCGGVRKIPCTVYCNGSLNWNGQLVVQNASHNSISAALVINPYPDGFGKQSLAENEDDEITISDSLATHDTLWKQFISASIHNHDVKFSPFFNEKGYGSDNESWGFWNGRARRKVVNELFFDENGNLIDSDIAPFSQANNKSFNVKESDGTNEETGESTWNIYIENNQLAFCPQIRIARILETWCRNAGYSFINHLGDDINGSFIQSQKSLDATQSQFGIESGLTITTYNGKTEMPYIHDGATWLPYSGWWEFNMQCDILNAQFRIEHPEEAMDPANAYALSRWPIKIFLYTGTSYPEELGSGQYNNGIILFEDEIQDTGSTFYLKNDKIRIATADEGLKYAVIAQYDYYESEGLGGGYYSEPTKTFSRWQYVTGIEMIIKFHFIAPDQKQCGFNIFRSGFCIPELLPDVTNSSFIKTMLDTFGLCYYISAKTKAIELVPYSKLDGAGNINLTDFELNHETEVQTPDETTQIFRLQPINDEGYNENLRITDQDGNHLPDAYINHEHYVLLKKTNTLYHATVQEHDDFNWTEGWVEHSGNQDKLSVGKGEEQKREPGVKIPHQRFVGGGRIHPETDAATGETPQLMVADFTICSDMYNTNEKPSDIILTQYRGLRKREYNSSQGHYVWNEVMLPVWNGEFSLTANGANSLGEKYVKPVLELSNHKTITYKLRLPANMMQPVEDLLRPSELPPEKQTRYIVIRNVKTVPKKITFQIDNNRDDTVLCQIEAVKVY